MKSVEEIIQSYYNTFGPRKKMGISSTNPKVPHYFLHRKFLNDLDLLIIFNTKRCRYQCDFCSLPNKSKLDEITKDDIVNQFIYTISKLKHSLHMIDRITISNDGSVLDTDTFPVEGLFAIIRGINEMKGVKRLVLETRLEFINIDNLKKIQDLAPNITVEILTGFETLNKYIRDVILNKQEPLNIFLDGLDKIASAGCELTSYILFKPNYTMTDIQAIEEAEASIDYLKDECLKRKIPFTIRLNPMYAAIGSKWSKNAKKTPKYKPPRITDVMKLAEKKRKDGIKVYIGASSEGIAESWGTYMQREDYNTKFKKYIILFNSAKDTSSFREVI